MAWALVLVAALSGDPPDPTPAPGRPWRLVDTPTCHVGARGHVTLSEGEVGAAVTVQVTASWLTL